MNDATQLHLLQTEQTVCSNLLALYPISFQTNVTEIKDIPRFSLPPEIRQRYVG